MSGDAIPEPILHDEPSNVQTVELCSERHDGVRCALLKGHGGPHEGLGLNGVLQWESRAARNGRRSTDVASRCTRRL